LRARPRTSRLVVAAILAVTGGTFLGQGLGYIPGSFMTGDPFWAVVGVVLLVAAAALVGGELRR
jgi:hypothetical protein